MSKFALLSHVLPPSPSGQAVVLYRIFSNIKGNLYYLINTRNFPSVDQGNANGHFRLQSQYYSLPAEPIFNHSYYFGLSWILKVINIFIRFFVRTKNVLAVLRLEPATNALIICTGDLVDIPAGFVAGKICKIPFYIYVFDDYLYQFTGGERWIVKLIAPFIFKRSAGFIGPNEFVCKEYQRRYGVPAALVRNPCDKPELEKEPYPYSRNLKDGIKIIYTGAVYTANYDCFRNLIQAMNMLEEYPVELHIFTTRTPEELKVEGIYGSRTFVHPHLPNHEILEQQRRSDILFLPLAFESPIPEIIRTSAPGKLGEYLASGRPILAHVPVNSFVAYYLKKNQCGLVASENDPFKLRDHIVKLINDENLCCAMTSRARQMAKLDFDPQVASKNLIDFLSVVHKNNG